MVGIQFGNRNLPGVGTLNEDERNRIPQGIAEDPQLLAEFVSNRQSAKDQTGAFNAGNVGGNGVNDVTRNRMLAAFGLPPGSTVDNQTLVVMAFAALQEGANSTNPETKQQFQEVLAQLLRDDPALLGAVESAGATSGGGDGASAG